MPGWRVCAVGGVVAVPARCPRWLTRTARPDDSRSFRVRFAGEGRAWNGRCRDGAVYSGASHAVAGSIPSPAAAAPVPTSRRSLGPRETGLLGLALDPVTPVESPLGVVGEKFG